jgi:hypothetical protein
LATPQGHCCRLPPISTDGVAHSRTHPSPGLGHGGEKQRRTADPTTRFCNTLRGINALAETVIGLYKAELIRRRGPWKGLDQIEYATVEWVDWFNHRQLLEPIGHVPPAEFEAAHWRRETPGTIEGLKHPSLQ